MGVRNVVPEVLFPRDHIRLRPPSLAQPESFSVAAIPPAAILVELFVKVTSSILVEDKTRQSPPCR